MPLFLAKKEVYEWLKDGKKTIDVRRGRPKRGSMAVFQSGPSHIRFQIVKKEIGVLAEVIRNDNYQQIIPTAENVIAARKYLIEIYGGDIGVFTAYYLSRLAV